MMERFLLRLARAIHAGPKAIAAACLLTAAAGAVLVSRMTINSDLLDVLDRKSVV
jgi:hypothetical protein